MRRYFNKHNAIWFSIYALFLYVLASPVVGKHYYESILFQPWFSGSDNKTAKPIHDVPCKVVTIPTKTGAALNAWYFANPKARKTIVLSHGNAGDIADRAILIGELLDAGASVCAFDYAGYGQSTGKPSIDEIMIDGDAATTI